MNDNFLFANDVPDEDVVTSVGSWKVIIVDDEPEVHAVTKLALSDFRFQDKNLEFLSAYSGAEGKQLIDQHPDAAIILLDVVMETDDAGLQVAKYIRESANNQNVRIILRTGQPGQAPERQVILDYDINDYKSKTELTAQKLFTVVMSSLRAYRDIIALDNSRRGLHKIIEASANIFSSHSMEHFIDGVMQQLTSIIGCGTEQAMYVTNSLMINCSPQEHLPSLRVVAAQGKFQEALGKAVEEFVDPELQHAFDEAIQSKSIVYRDDYLVAYCYSRFSSNSLLYVSGIPHQIGENERTLIELFTQNVQIAYENVQLQVELEDTQKEIVYRLGEAVEKRSVETGNHVSRVASICEILATKLGLSSEEIDILKAAAPLHDVGKVSIPDNILNKPGPLEADEWALMKTHAQIGAAIMADSKRPIVKAGAVIAMEHHENWDGSGYPVGKKGKEIHIFARIAAIADVFDALRHKRCYKEAWNREDAIRYIKSESGKKFDPELVEVFSDSLDELESLFG